MAREGSTRALVPLPVDVCPECSGALLWVWAGEATLFRHGGYGALRQTRVELCGGCGWHGRRQVTEVSPR